MLLLPSAALAGQSSLSLGEAGQTVDAFHAALEKGDGERAKSLLDDAVQIYEQGWVEHSKAEYVKEHLPSDLKFSQATTSTQASRSGVLLGDLAYVSSEGRTTGTFEGKPVDSITLETMVLRRSAGGWRIVHIHWSSRKAK